jgi:hypothetical protein
LSSRKGRTEGPAARGHPAQAARNRQILEDLS